MATSMINMLGRGMLSLQEAALYSRVSARLLGRWFFGSKKGESVFSPKIVGDEKVISFYDFVQAVAIREIRIVKKIPLQKFRQAIKIAKNQHNLDYPFARRHATFWDGAEIIICPDGERFIEASGQHAGQPLFRFVELYLEKLEFDDSGLANLYRIFEHDRVPITMNPRVRFGEPMLPSGVSALTIFEAIEIEGSPELAAKAYGISLKEVKTAYRFFVEFLGGKAA